MWSPDGKTLKHSEQECLPLANPDKYISPALTLSNGGLKLRDIFMRQLPFYASYSKISVRHLTMQVVLLLSSSCLFCLPANKCCWMHSALLCHSSDNKFRRRTRSFCSHDVLSHLRIKVVFCVQEFRLGDV